MRFPGFEGEWEVRKIESLGTFSGGGTPDTSIDRFWSGDIPWISSSDLIEGDIHNIIKYRFITKEAIDNSATKITPKGSILMVSRVGVGKFAVADENLCTSQDFTNLITDENEYFICYYFQAKINVFIGLSQGTSIKGFTTKDIKSAKFSIPKLLEQQKISSFLTLIDKRINTQNKIIEELEQLIKGLCINLILKQVPNTKLNQCVICNTSSLTESEVINQQGTHPVYGATGIITYTVDYQIDKDAILIIKDGSGVGKVQYATNKFSVIGTLNYLTIKSQVNLRYILYSLKFFNFEKYKVGSGIPHIYFKDYGEALIYCPSLAEQYKIEGLLSSIDKKIEIEKQNLNQLNLQKQFLLKELFI
ncbi:restriction endonuclease subunit S [Myroides odoratimimus]|uniref:restriction endonuclease subunit S n=1 Tax=Myroides odoratimimus TaxID=76832 RepID=UPI0031018E6D